MAILFFTPSKDFAFTSENISKYKNYIVIIKYNFSIGNYLNLPCNCTLRFTGGSLRFHVRNVTPDLYSPEKFCKVSGDNITIENNANVANILTGLKFVGSITNEEVYAKWFFDSKKPTKTTKGLYDRSNVQLATDNMKGLSNASLSVRNKKIIIDEDIYFSSKWASATTRTANNHCWIGINKPKIIGISGFLDNQDNVQTSLAKTSSRALRSQGTNNSDIFISSSLQSQYIFDPFSLTYEKKEVIHSYLAKSFGNFIIDNKFNYLSIINSNHAVIDGNVSNLITIMSSNNCIVKNNKSIITHKNIHYFIDFEFVKNNKDQTKMDLTFNQPEDIMQKSIVNDY